MSALVPIGNPTSLGRVGTEVRSTTAAEKAFLALAGLGSAGLLFALLAPGSSAAQGWLGTVWFALVSVGGAGYFWLSYRGSTPGIKNHGVFHSGMSNRGAIGWALGVALTGFYVLVYWYGASLSRAYGLLDPLAVLITGQPADHWFLYGALYTAAVAVFGTRMAMKYRHNRYQLFRTASVTFFQLGFAFVLPGLLKRMNQPDFYFTYFWPLKPEYLLPFSQGWTIDVGSLGLAMILWGAGMIFVATPVLTYFFGKRWYCSWVCGCGGLAETLGDPWRQLSDKSDRAWKIERWMVHSVLVVIAAITLVGWLHEHLGRPWWSDGGQALYYKTYGFVIASMFSGVIGVGFYPLMGSRVWCRFGCPMAAILGIFQRFYSRFRITTNGGQCISCGNCSTYCEMGIDVRAYAQRGEDIVRASCVGCGVCAAVCPRGVLRLENSPVGDRYSNDGKVLVALADSLRGRPR